MAKKEKCFVMMPFTTPEKYKDTDHFDKVYEQIFVPAIEKAGYEPYRVDENKICDSIIGKIFDAVRTAPMALCDLSNKNPNVLYELGLRQAYDMPVVLVQDDITDRIFDVSGISTVTYSSHRLVENVNEAIKAISEAIIQTKEGKESTLAKIVKVKSADFDSIEITNNDNINIMLNTIMKDIKCLKNDIVYTNEKEEKPALNLQYYQDYINTKFEFKLKQGLTDLHINQILNQCKSIYGVEVLSKERRGDILRLHIKHYDGYDVKYEIAEYLHERLCEKKG